MEEQSQGKQLNRRSFIQGIAATGALGIMAGAGLSGCAPQQQSAAAEAPQQEADASAGEVHEWVDAVSSASLATNKYTTFTETQLQDAVMAYQTECVVSTSNEDGTPNIAIFVPAAMIDEAYVAFTWAENQTKANFERAKIGMIAFDVPDGRDEGAAPPGLGGESDPRGRRIRHREAEGCRRAACRVHLCGDYRTPARRLTLHALSDTMGATETRR